jgi:hypothetical protein
MIQKTVVLMAVLLLIVGSATISYGDQCASRGKSAKLEGKAETVTFEGKLVCVGCDLKKAEGARSECSFNGHRHALKTSDGRYISLLENKYSADLVKGEKYSGKDIEVQGTYYANANQLDVKSYTVNGKEMSWCGHCKKMDGCMANKGGM